MGYTNSGPYIPDVTNYDPTPPTYISMPAPYVEPDKSSKTTALFQGLQGLVTSAADFYQRIKYRPQPVAGRAGDPNLYWGGGGTVAIPGFGPSGEPLKLGGNVQGGISPVLLIGIVVIIAVIIFLRK